MMCNLLLYIDIKFIKIYGNGKFGFDYYILVKKYFEQLGFIGVDNQIINVKKL